MNELLNAIESECTNPDLTFIVCACFIFSLSNDKWEAWDILNYVNRDEANWTEQEEELVLQFLTEIKVLIEKYNLSSMKFLSNINQLVEKMKDEEFIHSKHYRLIAADMISEILHSCTDISGALYCLQTKLNDIKEEKK